jgi:hypothetical protein
MTTDGDRALSPGALMQLSTGFWAFETLAAARALDVFSQLSGPAKHDDRYVNSPLADAFLVGGNSDDFDGGVQILDQRLYPGWGRLVEAIRTNRPTTWDPDRQDSMFDGEDPELLAVFWEAMHSLGTFTDRALGEDVELSGSRRLHRLVRAARRERCRDRPETVRSEQGGPA